MAAYKEPKEIDETDDGLGPMSIAGMYEEAEIDMTGWDHKRIMLKLIGDALERKTGTNYNSLYGQMPNEMLTIALDEFPALNGDAAAANGTEVDPFAIDTTYATDSADTTFSFDTEQT